MSNPIEQLTFDFAGDICLAMQDGGLKVADLPETRADTLGPLLELRHFKSSLLIDQRWLTTTPHTALLHKLGSASVVWYEPELGRQGFVRVSKLQNDGLAWPDFMIRAKRAAKDAGFSDDHAAKLSAVIGELYSNVIEHSHRARTGYIAFCAKNRSFEFVVADEGIGVLNSLRSNLKFASLADAGSALELALSQGISRHTEAGHGNGFQPLFVGLANISRHIRFRSDDHSRELARLNDGKITSVTRQVAMLRGFFCSVLCDVDGSIHP